MTKPEEIGHLSLHRKAGDKILIGDNIVVTIISIGVRNVQIIVTAPKSIRVLRGEIIPPERRLS